MSQPAAPARRNTAVLVLSVLLALSLIGVAVTTTLWLSASQRHGQVATQLATRDGELAVAKKNADEAKKTADEAVAKQAVAPSGGSDMAKCQAALRQMMAGGVEDGLLRSACGV